MANATGSFNGATITPKNSSYASRKWHCNLAWSRTDYTTYSAITITVTFVTDGGGNWGQVGNYLRGTGWISGTQGINYTGESWVVTSGQDKVIGTYTKNINRTTSAQSIAISASTWLTTSSAYDNGTSTASGNVPVPALPSYTISFYGNNASSGSTAAQTKYYNINLALRSNGFSKSGYSFMGWGTSASATSVSYANGATYSANAGANLYAIWRKTITISYNANGGSGAPAAQNGYAYNSATSTSITISGTTPTRVGYTTDGWAKSASGIKEYNKNTSYPFSVSTTLYAHWNLINYNLSYDYDGGAVATDNPTTYNTETSTFTLVEPTKDYYRFLGWTGTNGTTPQKNLSITTGSIGDRSYVANWERTYVAPTLIITECKRDNSEHSGDDSGVVPHITFSWVAGTDERTAEDIISVVPTGYTITFRNQNTESLEPAHVYTHTYTSEEVDSETQSRIESVYCNEINGNLGLNTESSYDVTVELILEDYDNITESDYISPAYFIIDINADGTAIGFGTAVKNTDDGFFSNLDIIAEKDFFFVLDSDAGTGTDFDIRQALIALGWLEEENN